MSCTLLQSAYETLSQPYFLFDWCERICQYSTPNMVLNTNMRVRGYDPAGHNDHWGPSRKIRITTKFLHITSDTYFQPS